VAGTRTKLLLYDTPTEVWFLLFKHLFPARWIMIFYEFLNKEVLCSLLQNTVGVALERLSVTAEASAYSFVIPNVTSFRTRTSNQTMALCVAAFN
jgi:hypothetical protein